jgi:hypothetical protein
VHNPIKILYPVGVMVIYIAAKSNWTACSRHHQQLHLKRPCHSFDTSAEEQGSSGAKNSAQKNPGRTLSTRVRRESLPNAPDGFVTMTKKKPNDTNIDDDASPSAEQMLSRLPDRNGHLSVKVFRDMIALEELREFFSLQERAPTGSLDFFQSVICCSPAVVRPHVIVLFRGGQPASLLLGRLERRTINVRLGYLGVPTPKLNILTFDDGGWLKDISAGDSELFIQEILSSLRSREADAANLQHVDTSHPLSQLARSRPGCLSSDSFPLMQVHWIRRFTDKGPFLHSLSANERYNQRRRARRLSDAFGGEPRIECFHDGRRIEQLLKNAEAVASTSYQRGLGVGFVNNDKMQHRLELAAKQGVLRAHVLYLADKPCAFWIASLSNGVFYNDFMAFDPAHAKYGPGSYLAIKVIEEVRSDICGPPLAILDFGPGDAEWKARLGNDQRRLISIYIFAPSPKAIACNLLRTFVGITDHSIKALLRRAGLLTHVKRKWRSLLAQSLDDK